MTQEEIHYKAKEVAAKLISFICCRTATEPYPDTVIEGLLTDIQREIDNQAKEDSELLAYNCEKRVRQELIDKACDLYNKELVQFVSMLNWVDNGKGDLIDVEKSIEQFRIALNGE